MRLFSSSLIFVHAIRLNIRCSENVWFFYSSPLGTILKEETFETPCIKVILESRKIFCIQFCYCFFLHRFYIYQPKRHLNILEINKCPSLKVVCNYFHLSFIFVCIILLNIWCFESVWIFYSNSVYTILKEGT